MKLLKKLIPLATIASTAAVVAPMVACSCGSGVNIKNYTTKYTPVEGLTVQDSDELITKYLSLNEAKEIIKDDVLTYLKKTLGIDGYSLTVNLSVTNTDSANKTFSFKCSGNLSFNRQIEGSGTVKVNESFDYTITNMPLFGYVSNGASFYIPHSQSNFTQTTKVVGSLSGSGEYGGASVEINTGTQTIEKGTTLDAKKTQLLSFLEYFEWSSNYFSKVTIK